MTDVASVAPAVRRKPPFRADHVGSFPRPKQLLDAHDQHKAGTLSAIALRAIDDDAIRDIVRYQDPDLDVSLTRNVLFPHMTERQNSSLTPVVSNVSCWRCHK